MLNNWDNCSTKGVVRPLRDRYLLAAERPAAHGKLLYDPRVLPRSAECPDDKTASLEHNIRQPIWLHRQFRVFTLAYEQ